MKVRFTVPCEKCKVPIPVGRRAIRMYGRLWCLTCVDQKMKARTTSV